MIKESHVLKYLDPEPNRQGTRRNFFYAVGAGLSNRPVACSHIAVGAMGLPPLHVATSRGSCGYQDIRGEIQMIPESVNKK
jgi:hypothetical protein